MGSLGVVRNFKEAKEMQSSPEVLEQAHAELDSMKEQVKQLSGVEADEMNDQIADLEKMLDLPSAGTFTFIGILMAVLALVSLVAGVFLFKPGHKIATILLGTAIVAGLIAIFLSPGNSSEYGPASLRTLSTIVTIPAVLATFFAFVMRNGKKPAQA
ncbi:hypothetical protein HYN59_06340 [Flavobacterium album]|uniref:Uncharacterized protein n=2 Tax=Flavobacterium album TaxID=2175091 RepID=A0A2S1QWK0_9FLAO|nr:hypothetical protein HYN59_06340 [Flavobacterium album]